VAMTSGFFLRHMSKALNHEGHRGTRRKQSEGVGRKVGLVCDCEFPQLRSRIGSFHN
jgi:hypothetical protein